METTTMSAPQPDVPFWTRSAWIKWSWLLVVAVIVAQSLSIHWRAMPTSASGYFARGRADFLAAQYERAALNFSKSIERDPDDADAYIYRGECYANQQQFGKALPDIDKALQLRPDYEKSHAADGDVKAMLWNAPGAMAAYSRALELDPDYTRCYLQRGMSAYDMQRWRDAEGDLRQGATRLLTDSQITSQLLLWVARARTGDASGATDELLAVMRVGRIRGDRFWAAAQFLTGQVTEPDYLAAVAKMPDDEVEALKAEAFFLAGGKRLAFGDRAAGLTLMRNAIATEAETSYAYERARAELATLLVGFHPMATAQMDAGLVIASVTPGGPAEAAGLRPGVTLAAIDGVPAAQESFVEFLASAEPGSTVELQLKDGAGAITNVPLTLTPGSSAPTK
jgi:tetratricopeptide (TPR) repeat protein